jgi:transposase
MKLIDWDRTGVCLFAKRLEDGRFRWPSVQDGVIDRFAIACGACKSPLLRGGRKGLISAQPLRV